MGDSIVRTLSIAAVVVAPFTGAGGLPQASFESLNVCQRVPGAAVAAALSGRPIDERPVNVKGLTAARCVYGVDVDGARRAIVVWINPAADFTGLRDASAPPVATVHGVGDEAFATTDKDTKRVQLTATLRGKVTVQVTSERMDWAEAVARVALARF